MKRGKRSVTISVVGVFALGALATGCKKKPPESVVPPGTKLNPARAAMEATAAPPDIRQPKGKGKIQPPRVLGEK